MTVNSCYFLVVVFVYFLTLGFVGVRLSVACGLFFGAANFFGLDFSFYSSTFCKVEFAERYYLNMVLSWNILFSLSMVIVSFAECSILDWHLRPLNVCSTSV